MQSILVRLIKDLKLRLSHDIKIESSTFHFSSEERFEEWLREHKISTNYALVHTRTTEDKIEKVYCCNRSDFRGELLGECSFNNIEASHSLEIETFVNEKTTANQQVAVQRLNKQSTREIEIESVSNFLKSLNDETYDKCMRQLTSIMDQINKTNTSKRKMDKQVYFPSKKKKEQ
ncbi:uncharacterized protein LOC126734332 [Anthonomus grandis grandis]|uniref:uncharacterized protein LOC126734332 n=1 Tax=Anthonomus grandis grandis TaxID=2921223 RepID=UPI0021650EE3|nr:uncharacterized protein LOC126734332 [Anthonomus grandis grandis]